MRYGKEECTSHYITLDQISEVVLEDIRRQARFAKYCRTGYMQLLMEEQQLRDEEEMEQQKEKADQAQKRLTQIDAVIRKLLKQNAVGVISDDRFAAMMKDYETEQAYADLGSLPYLNRLWHGKKRDDSLGRRLFGWSGF